MNMLCHIYRLLVFVSILGFIIIPLYSFAEANQFDQQIINAGKQRAEQMGHNPVCIYTNKTGGISITQSKFAIRQGKVKFIHGDMVINVGKEDVTVMETILKKGEYGIIKNDKLEKGKDLILQ